jgi:hypothetical protein
MRRIFMEFGARGSGKARTVKQNGQPGIGLPFLFAFSPNSFFAASEKTGQKAALIRPA